MRKLAYVHDPDRVNSIIFVTMTGITTVSMIAGVTMALVQVHKIRSFYMKLYTVKDPRFTEDIVPNPSANPGKYEKYISKERLQKLNNVRKTLEFCGGYVLGALMLLVDKIIKIFRNTSLSIDPHDANFEDKCAESRGILGFNFKTSCITLILLAAGIFMIQMTGGSDTVGSTFGAYNNKENETGDSYTLLDPQLTYKNSKDVDVDVNDKTSLANFIIAYQAKNSGITLTEDQAKPMFAEYKNKLRIYNILDGNLTFQQVFSRAIVGLAAATSVDMVSQACLGCSPIKPDLRSQELWMSSLQKMTPGTISDYFPNPASGKTIEFFRTHPGVFIHDRVTLFFYTCVIGPVLLITSQDIINIEFKEATNVYAAINDDSTRPKKEVKSKQVTISEAEAKKILYYQNYWDADYKGEDGADEGQDNARFKAKTNQQAVLAFGSITTIVAGLLFFNILSKLATRGSSWDPMTALTNLFRPKADLANPTAAVDLLNDKIAYKNGALWAQKRWGISKEKQEVADERAEKSKEQERLEAEKYDSGNIFNNNRFNSKRHAQKRSAGRRKSRK